MARVVNLGHDRRSSLRVVMFDTHRERNVGIGKMGETAVNDDGSFVLKTFDCVTHAGRWSHLRCIHAFQDPCAALGVAAEGRFSRASSSARYLRAVTAKGPPYSSITL
jgi:hypothetical protein